MDIRFRLNRGDVSLRPESAKCFPKQFSTWIFLVIDFTEYFGRKFKSSVLCTHRQRKLRLQLCTVLVIVAAYSSRFVRWAPLVQKVFLYYWWVYWMYWTECIADQFSKTIPSTLLLLGWSFAKWLPHSTGSLAHVTDLLKKRQHLLIYLPLILLFLNPTILSVFLQSSLYWTLKSLNLALNVVIN